MVSFKTDYRSYNFDTYEGNERNVQRVLERFAVPDKPYPKTVILFGESGRGKTTLARLIDRQIHCTNKQIKVYFGKEYHVMCEECDSCQMRKDYILTGEDSFLRGTREYDSAEVKKTEVMRRIVDEAMLPTMMGVGYETYIFDECHALTPTAQTDLLKFTEESPANKVFMFCTTDKDKMLSTLITRMDMKIEIEAPTIENIVHNLERVCKGEGISYEKDALSLIAERSNFGYRTALTYLEDVYQSSSEVSYDAVVDVLSVQNSKVYFDFFNYLKAHQILLLNELIYSQVKKDSIKVFVQGLLRFLVKGIYVSNGLDVMGVSRKDISQYKALLKEFEDREIYLLIEALEKCLEGDTEVRLLKLSYGGMVSLENKPIVVERVAKSVDGAVVSGQSGDIEKPFAVSDKALESSVQGVKAQRAKEISQVSVDEALKPVDPFASGGGSFN